MIENIKELFRFSKTKALGWFITLAGTLYGFINKDAATMIYAWLMGLVLVGGKTSINSYLKLKGAFLSQDDLKAKAAKKLDDAIRGETNETTK